jgi:F0F1-type ATP synthase assembly protein I
MADDSRYLKKAVLQLSDGAIGAGVLVALGVVAGGWLDGKMHSGPWFTLGLSLVGGGLGLGRLVKKALDLANDPLNSAPVAKTGNEAAGSFNPESGPQPRAPYQKWDDEE